ncbi:MAG: hypothetical protein KBD01_18295 [Acidobacteria bacterium]|nr:hypothetical protein [Acidobacteriota bacterium]
MARERTITMKCSETEYRSIQKAASTEGIPVTTWARRALTQAAKDEAPRTHHDLRKRRLAALYDSLRGDENSRALDLLMAMLQRMGAQERPKVAVIDVLEVLSVAAP